MRETPYLSHIYIYVVICAYLPKSVQKLMCAMLSFRFRTTYNHNVCFYNNNNLKKLP
jgi:hypothetical protein